jgi:hypothetical protein
MRPLPAKRYEYGEWKRAKVNIDYHIEADHNYYSVHYGLIHKTLDVRLSASTVEIYQRGRHQTQHAHRKHLQWPPERILAWGGKTGPCTEAVMFKVMAGRRHPEQGFRYTVWPGPGCASGRPAWKRSTTGYHGA